MTTHVQRRDDANGQGLSDLVQVRRASGEILQLPAADCYSPTSFAMLLDNWHQFEARHDDVWLFGYPRSGQDDRGNYKITYFSVHTSVVTPVSNFCND